MGENQYQNCPKCGTRNFADDKKCGICNTKLSAKISQLPLDQGQKKEFNYRPVLLISLLVLTLYFFISNDADPNSISNQKKRAEQQLENNPALQLSVLNDKTDSPNELTTRMFDELLTSLSNQYVNYTKQKLANAIVTGHDLVTASGKEITHLELTLAFEAFSKELDNKFKTKIEENMALFLKMVYKI